MKYADVIIDISHEKLDKTFQYEIPLQLQDAVRVGSQVVIPFGNGDRRVKGFVVDMAEEPKIAPERIKPICGVRQE